MQLSQKGRKLVRNHHQGIERLARIGFIARALNYATIGLLAFQFAIGSGGRLTDSNGALQVLSKHALGPVLLTVLGIGFAGYGLWFLIKAFYGQPNASESRQNSQSTHQSGKQPSTHKKMFKRISAGFVGAFHLFLSIGVFRVLLHLNSTGDKTKAWTAHILAQPLGVWAIAITGLIVCGVGLYQIYKAFIEKFKDEIDLSSLSAKTRSGFIKLAKWGISARGVVFCIIGWFLVQAALNHNPNQARSLGGALYIIASQPFGKILLGIVAIGLILYAVFSAFEARYYRVEVSA